MGGGAFLQAAADGEPTLSTPRMSPDEYTLLKATYTDRLQNYLLDCKIACLQEAPEKTSYGDIDFIISTTAQIDMIELARHIGARAVIPLSSGDFQRCTLAVLKDESRSERPAVVYKHVNLLNANGRRASEMRSDEEYAQIDIEVIPPELFEWHMFYASYGDMASLLGKFVHYFGFTVTDKGLLLRLRELDEAKAAEGINVEDSAGKLFLSRDPDRVMRFLGFSPKQFHQGFTTTQQFYEWLADCRLLSPDTVKYKRNNAHERNREKTRPIYTNFLEKWLPAHFGVVPVEKEVDISVAEKAVSPEVLEKRRKLRDEALEFFGKREEYEVMHDALVLSIRNQTAALLLKPILAEHSKSKDKKLAEIVRAFRRWVNFEDGKAVVAQTPHTDEESQLHLWLSEDGKSLRDQGAVSEWAKEQWEELKTLERQRLKDARGPPA